MSFQDCIDEVKRAAGRDMDDQVLDDLISSLRRRQKQKRIEMQGASAEETLLAAADDMAQQALSAALIEKRNTALNLKARNETLDYIRTNFASRPDLGLEARMTGVNSAVEGARWSADAEQRQLEGFYTQGMIADVEEAGLWQEFISGELDRDIARELWEIGPDGQPGITGSSDARKLAEIVNKWQETTRADGNYAGANIRRLPGYIVRQSHDMFKIGNVAEQEWIDFILPRLDAERTFEDVPEGEYRTFLRRVYEGLASGVHLANGVDAGPSGFKGFGNLAKRMSEDRVLHFKDADAWYDYNERFGVGSLRESLLFGFQRMSRQTGLMRLWGPNPESNYDQVFTELLNEQDVKGKRRLRDARSWLDNRYAEIDGSVNIPGNVMLARNAATIRALQSMAKLGGATLSAIADLPLVASEFRYQGMGFLESYGVGLRGLLQGRGREEQRQILGMLGVAMDGMAGNAVYRFSGQDDLTGWSSRAMRTFFKWNGLTWWTDSLRASSALAMSRRLGMVKGQAWGKLDPDLRRTLSLFGIGENDWGVLRASSARSVDNQAYVVPEGVRDVNDQAVRTAMGNPKATKQQVAAYKRRLEGQLRSYFADRTEYAVINPDARTNAILRRGTQPGTVEGEFMRFITQFKSFPVAVLTKSAGREVFGRGAVAGASVSQALRSGNGEMLGLANLLLSTTAFGYLAMSAKDLAKGRTPRDPNDRKTWLAAMTQGGGFGIYGDFLFGDIRNRFGGGLISTIAGPTFGTVEDIADIMGRIRDGDDAAAQAFSVLLNNTPFANIFYSRMMLDYLFLYQLRESMNPGYLKRMERRIQKENAQRFMLRPSQTIPTGGGNRLLEGVR